MKSIILKLKHFSFPLVIQIILTGIAGEAVRYLLFDVLKIDTDYLKGCTIAFAIFIGIETYFTFRYKLGILNRLLDGNIIVLPYFITVGATFFFSNSVSKYLASTKQETLNCIYDLKEYNSKKDFKLQHFYIDKSNFGFDKLKTVHTSNGQFSHQTFEATYTCPIFCDSLESIKTNKQVGFWLVGSSFHSFSKNIAYSEQDSIFNDLSYKYIMAFLKDSINFEYVDYTPYLKDNEQCMRAAKESPKFSESQIKGFIRPHKQSFSSENDAELISSLQILAPFCLGAIILPLLFGLNYAELERYLARKKGD